VAPPLIPYSVIAPEQEMPYKQFSGFGSLRLGSVAETARKGAFRFSPGYSGKISGGA
jgi:hypothetical protein